MTRRLCVWRQWLSQCYAHPIPSVIEQITSSGLDEAQPQGATRSEAEATSQVPPNTTPGSPQVADPAPTGAAVDQGCADHSRTDGRARKKVKTAAGMGQAAQGSNKESMGDNDKGAQTEEGMEGGDADFESEEEEVRLLALALLLARAACFDI
jgi:hypothetical protein